MNRLLDSCPSKNSLNKNKKTNQQSGSFYPCGEIHFHSTLLIFRRRSYNGYRKFFPVPAAYCFLIFQNPPIHNLKYKCCCCHPQTRPCPRRNFAVCITSQDSGGFLLLPCLYLKVQIIVFGVFRS